MKVGDLPRGRLKPYAVDWAQVAEHLKEHPNTPVLFLELTDTPRLRSIRVSVRHGHIGKLRDLGGIVVPIMRNSRTVEGNRKRGDLWLEWRPDVDPLEYYSKRAIERGKAVGQY